MSRPKRKRPILLRNWGDLIDEPSELDEPEAEETDLLLSFKLLTTVNCSNLHYVEIVPST